MGITEATRHLAQSLLPQFESRPQKSIIERFLIAISTVVEFRERGKAAAWEVAVLKSLNDNEWVELEASDEYPLLEAIWEVSRGNLFGAIQGKESSKFYKLASNLMHKRYDLSVRPSSDFDFSSL